MKVCMMIGKQAGMIGLLTILAKRIDVEGVVSYGSIAWEIRRIFGIRDYKSIFNRHFKHVLKESDLLVSVHGHEVATKEILELPRIGCINVHPCLYKYKGADPIKRLLKDGATRASVGVHWMTEDVDSGDVIVEKFIDIPDCKTVVDVYNELYPLYSLALFEAIDKIRGSGLWD